MLGGQGARLSAVFAVFTVTNSLQLPEKTIIPVLRLWQRDTVNMADKSGFKPFEVVH